MFSRKARAGDAMRRSPMKGRSVSNGGGPLRGRKVIPGKTIPRFCPAMRNTEPSGAGRFSRAVRSAISAPGR